MSRPNATLPRSRHARAEVHQLALDLGAMPPLDALVGAASIAGLRLTLTRALRAHSSCARAIAVVRETLHFFPELDGVPLRVGLTRTASGWASMESDEIWVNPHRLSRHTVAHEFVHLLQRRRLAPRGEKSCDLFAFARHPDLADDLPAYLKVPTSFRKAWGDTPAASRIAEPGRLIHATARDAVQRRDSGRRRYIVWFEEEFARRWDEVRQTTRHDPAVTRSLW